MQCDSVECGGSEQSNTPLVEAVRVLSRRDVEVDSEEQLGAGRVEINGQRQFALLARVEAGGGAHPPQKGHGQVHHDGRGQIEGVGPALRALQLEADHGKAAVVTRGYGIGVVGDCDVQHQLLQGPAVGLSNALAGGGDVSLGIQQTTEPNWEGLKCE
jgi:hypothetical protein